MAAANTTPSVSTMVRTKLSDGRLLGVEGDMWLVRKLPLEPVADAKSVEERMNVYMPLMAAYEELAAMATTTGSRRSMSRGSYRQTQLLLVNVAKLYNPSGHKIAGFLKESFPTQITEKRIALFAVRLVAKVGSNGGWQKALDSVVETLVSGGTPLSDFDDDYRKVDAAMARSGLATPTAQELSLANSWWNQGEFPDTVDLPHSDHLHIFADTKAVRMANDAGREDCTKWPKIPKHHALTFATLEDFNFEFESSESTAAHWATGLVEDGAVAISIRGSVEPAKVTRAELRRQRKRYMDDINERHKNHKMEDARQEEMLATLEAVENVYAAGGSPTLVDASVLVAFNGEIDDITQAGPRSAANLRVMNFRQRQALAEMMLCSGIKANPNLHDLPIQTVACSGIQSLSTVGDKDGALLGFTERDSQPAYESPTAASSGDAAPIFVNLGATGSGKATTLTTRIPTPTGWTTMGELEVGSEVIGRDGKPCRVTFLSDINETPELYRIAFSDGQVIEADFDHQWVVSTDFDRQGGHHGKNARRQEIWDDSRVLLTELEALTSAYDENHESDLNQLFQIINGFVTKSPWTSVEGVRAALKFVEAPFRYVPTSQWTGSSAGGKCRVYNTAVALKSLHLRVTQQHHGRDASVLAERRMTTGEIIAAGVRKGADGSSYPRFAVHTAGALDLPEANLPVDPYVLGAWLGDGTTGEGTMASAATASCTDEFGVTDQAVMMQQFAEFSPTPRPSRPEFVFGTRGLVPKLREAGVLHNKHIPAAYLRGSLEQRLALLQGLMDTDGTVNFRTGEIKIGMSRKALMDQILDLVRSLGIKAGPVRSFETIRDQPLADGTSDVRVREIHEVSFRTYLPVFRLPRKLAKMRQYGPKIDWIYIESIEKIDPVPARCIQVDSPDHTYLVGDYLPTSNTMVLLWKAIQFAKLGGPQVIIDPKEDSDHSPTVLAHGGQVASLDDLKEADGIFDPLRFSHSPTVGVELAVSMLASIDPWGGKASEFEVKLYTALAYGVSKGATCVGQALQIAKADGKATAELVDPVFELANTSPLFRACVGVDPKTKALSINEGITLIKVGKTHLNLPEPGAMASASVMQKVSLALVRMMVFGSAMALTGRGGAIHLDEAWVFLGAGKAEVERLGRLARSQQVLPELYTQRASDPLKAGLAGYISRGLILPIEDKDEARAALELFKLEATDERLSRITGKAMLGEGGTVAPNWNSMRALRDPATKKVLRGTVGYYSDLAGRCVPVQIVLPPAFLKLASTNADDLNERKKELALASV